MERLSRGFAWFLVVVHLGLGVWGVVGFLEFFLESVPWTRVTNPELPVGALLAQWGLVVLACGVYVVGFLGRRRWLPWALAVTYGMMASLCAVQTFSWLTNESRFVAMGVEYAEYALILWFVFGSRFMRERHGETNGVVAPVR